MNICLAQCAKLLQKIFTGDLPLRQIPQLNALKLAGIPKNEDEYRLCFTLYRRAIHFHLYSTVALITNASLSFFAVSLLKINEM